MRGENNSREHAASVKTPHLYKNGGNTQRIGGRNIQGLQPSCSLALELLLGKKCYRSYQCCWPSSMSCSKKLSAFISSVLPYEILTGACWDRLWAKSCFTSGPGQTKATRERQHCEQEASEPRGIMISNAKASTTFGHRLNRFPPHLLLTGTSFPSTKPLFSKRQSRRQRYLLRLLPIVHVAHLQVLVLRVAASSDHKHDHLSGRAPSPRGGGVSPLPQLRVEIQIRFILFSILQQTA